MKLVQQFCTPPVIPLTEMDHLGLADSDKTEFPFEGESLSCYRWGSGKTVLLAHGWGSRASHMAFIGRYLAASGFNVVAFDAPAHSSVDVNDKKTTSNMFEFCRAISAITKNIGPVYGLIGHSLGAASSVFAAAGYSLLADYKIYADKLVLISMPVSVNNMIRNYCVRNELDACVCADLKNGLEEYFYFSADEFTVADALAYVDADVLLVHDKYDEEFPVSDAHALQDANPGVELYITQGSGHHKILFNRKLLGKLKEFLNGQHTKA